MCASSTPSRDLPEAPPPLWCPQRRPAESGPHTPSFSLSAANLCISGDEYASPSELLNTPGFSLSEEAWPNYQPTPSGSSGMQRSFTPFGADVSGAIPFPRSSEAFQKAKGAVQAPPLAEPSSGPAPSLAATPARPCRQSSGPRMGAPCPRCGPRCAEPGPPSGPLQILVGGSGRTSRTPLRNPSEGARTPRTLPL